jgi:hypothetical protein
MSEALPSIDITKIEKKETQEYPREFFDLQIEVARKVMEIEGVSISQALSEYTGLYRRLKIGKSFDPNNPIWQEFVSTLNKENLSDKVYEFYLKRKDIELSPDPNRKKFGCFTFEYLEEDKCVRTHFGNNEKNGSPLSDENLPKRLAELKSLFQYAKDNYPQAQIVRGGSWIYNLAKYRRLFPPQYTQDLQPVTTSSPFRGFSGWGQFLDKNMEIKPELVQLFKDKLTQAKNIDEILESLPLKTFKVEGKVEDFYNFYGIK